MRATSAMMRLYAVTDRNEDEEEFLQKCEAALKGGATIFELREKETDFETFLSLAKKLKVLCGRYSVPFIVNDNVTVAKLSDADGVHLGQGDCNPAEAARLLGADKIIGVSAHNVKEALDAQAQGAGYLGCGAAFITSTKTDAKPIDRRVLKDICDAVEIPVIAIGGITSENICSLEGLGLDGVAVVSALFSSKDITAATAELLKSAERVALSSRKS